METTLNSNLEGKVFDKEHYKDLSEALNCEISLEELNLLVAKAESAKKNSYSPYSNFRVGCSILSNDNQYINGNQK